MTTPTPSTVVPAPSTAVAVPVKPPPVLIVDPANQALTTLLVEHKRLGAALERALRQRYDAEYQAHTHALDVERLTLAIESVEAGITAIKELS